MNYQEAEQYILDIPKFTSKNPLAHTKTFLSYLGNPQEAKKVIQVAGTNGKGSVCAYMQAMLQAEEKTVGLFTSPHLVTIRERISINGTMISETDFLSVFEEVRQAVKKMEQEGIPHPTFFEFLFGMAMRAFAKAKVTYIILETGLGGRLDATNSIEQPILTILTSIGMDHMEILGNTIEEIAAEKAGIIKEGVPVLYDGTDCKAARIIRKKAEEKGCFCKEITKNAYEIQEITEKDIAFSTRSAYDGNVLWKLKGTGVYEPSNAVLALEAMTCLVGEQTSKSESGRMHAAHKGRWKDALCSCLWKGRMEEIAPDVILDGAHNMPAIQALADSIQRWRTFHPKEKITALFSAVREKEYEQMIEYICKNVPADTFIVTKIKDVRAADLQELIDCFKSHTDKPVYGEETVPQAWKRARKEKGKGRLYCFGSLYLAGELEALVDQYK